MPQAWDKMRKKKMREGHSEDSAAALASAITGWVRKKGGGWRQKSDRARYQGLKAAMKGSRSKK